jgi:hypothetical protein
MHSWCCSPKQAFQIRQRGLLCRTYLCDSKRVDRAKRIDNVDQAEVLHRSPGHHVEGGSLAVILVARNAIRWLRLYGRP